LHKFDDRHLLLALTLFYPFGLVVAGAGAGLGVVAGVRTWGQVLRAGGYGLLVTKEPS